MAGLAAVVLAVLLAMAGGAAAGVHAHSASRVFTVNARVSHWVSTRWKVPAGSRVRFTASGNATCHEPSAVDCPVDHPGGIYLCENNPVIPNDPPGPASPSIRYDALVGRFGAHGKPFVIGHARTVRPTATPTTAASSPSTRRWSGNPNRGVGSAWRRVSCVPRADAARRTRPLRAAAEPSPASWTSATPGVDRPTPARLGDGVS